VELACVLFSRITSKRSFQLVMNFFEYVSERDNVMHRLGVRSFSIVAGAAKHDFTNSISAQRDSLHSIGSYNSISVGVAHSHVGGSERFGDNSTRFDADDMNSDEGLHPAGSEGLSPVRPTKASLDTFPEERDRDMGYSGSAMAAVMRERAKGSERHP